MVSPVVLRPAYRMRRWRTTDAPARGHAPSARRIEQPRRGHRAAFADGGGVGAAGGGAVARLEADAGGDQRSQQDRRGEALAAAGADQHDLDAERTHRLEIIRRQRVEAAARPAADDLAGGDQQIALMAHLVDQHVVLTVAGDDVGVGVVVEVELHGAEGGKTAWKWRAEPSGCKLRQCGEGAKITIFCGGRGPCPSIPPRRSGRPKMKVVKTLELAAAAPEPAREAEAAAAGGGAGSGRRQVRKSAKLAEVCYDIRGPVLTRAKQMEDEGHQIIKLNIGNLAAFGFDSPEEIQMDMIRNLPNAAGYSESKGIFS